MASISVVFSVLFLLSVAVGAQQTPSNLVRLGSSLYPITNPTSWVSPSGHFAFGFYPQGSGFAVGIWLVSKPENYVVWTANRDDPPVSSNAKIEFTRDGKLLLRTKQGQEKLIADGFWPAVSASMLDSGNFVLYDNESDSIWQSFDFPTDTILGGQDLPFGIQLISSKSRQDRSSGEYSLSFQENGKKLVSCPVNSMATPNDSIKGISMPGDCYWSILTRGREYFSTLKLSRSGRLYLEYSEASIHTVFNRSHADKNKTIIYRATLDADGVLRLYSHSFGIPGGFTMSIEWSAVQNLCEVRGICGFNSFCSGNNGIKANCSCLPGFVPTGNKSLGCYRNLSHEEICRRKEPPKLSYNITSLDYVSWGGTAYSVLKTNKEDCIKSCLEDCRCKAALYSSKSCSRYKLPLMYVRKDQTEYVAFVKLSLPTVERFLIERNKKLLTFTACLGSMSFLCSVVAICSFFVYRGRVRRYKKLPKNSDLGVIGEFTLRSFSFDELEKATDGFKEELGRGHFGAVYKGAISEGNKVIAVKRLEEVAEEGEREFQAEMTGIGRTHHRNVVQLFGFCVEGSTKLLVYEYMRNGSLSDLLFNTENRLVWKERVRIAVEVARGILYLHEECEYQIIHCDIKPQNILMDDSWAAKISDFRLAKVLMPNQNGIITGVGGTRGYVAPEWHKNVLISVKADVFSFGVVLLEIVCCRSNMEISVSTADEVLLSDWAYSCFVAGKLDKLVGDEEVEMRALERMVKVGLLCIQEDPSLRPSMKDVILMLEGGTVHVPVPPPPTPSPLSS